ncbi:hypothetical protein HID58_015288 [Brassica napus]|uniref:BZIP domain-containing protein n=2 Tax=Brassica TaxID=3705 RepID=A0ABQ8DJM8_BRANA|nr:hypothetical protein HID58_015288 [Brassica napus]
MDGHAGIPPSYSGLSQYPRANPFGDESSNRATMPPPSGSSLPPFPPTGQPFQFGSQNFIPAGSSPSQWMLSQVPHTMLESSSVGSGSSQPASVFSGLFNADQLSKIAASDELKEMAESDPKHLKITLSNRESAARSKAKKALHESELEDKVETLETQIDILTAELKLEKRGRMTADDECVQFRIRLHAGEAHARLREDLIQQLNGEVRRLIEEASVQREEMSRLREEVSEYRRRESERMNANMLDQLNINQQTLSNRESAARSKAKKALHESELEDKVETLETQIDILTAELKLEKRGRMTADDECVQFRIRLHAGEAHARLREDLIEQLNGEVRRLIEEASVQREEMSRLREEVSEYRRRESERMNANMLDQLNINQQFQEKPQQTNYNFE